MKIIPILLIALLAFVSCAKYNNKTLVDEENVSKVVRLHGLTQEAIVEELGDPFSQKQYKMKDASGEFRVELCKTYPLSDPANLEIEIKELWWKDGDYFITAWLHFKNDRWTVLNTCRWHKTVKF